jgi:hypothetical protein
LVLVLSHEDDQWRDAVFLDYVGSQCRVLWDEVEPGQSPTALVDPDDVVRNKRGPDRGPLKLRRSTHAERAPAGAAAGTSQGAVA